MSNNKVSYLSKFYGAYTIRMNDMGDLTCYIMDNLVGMDFPNIVRMYDLKGSTLKRKVKLS